MQISRASSKGSDNTPDHAADRQSGDRPTPRPSAIGDAVVVHPGTAQQATGRIVDDFGEFSAHAVSVNDTRIAEPARRWAVETDDGGLVFVDSCHLELLSSAVADAEPDDRR